MEACRQAARSASQSASMHYLRTLSPAVKHLRWQAQAPSPLPHLDAIEPRASRRATLASASCYPVTTPKLHSRSAITCRRWSTQPAGAQHGDMHCAANTHPEPVGGADTPDGLRPRAGTARRPWRRSGCTRRRLCDHPDWHRAARPCARAAALILRRRTDERVNPYLLPRLAAVLLCDGVQDERTIGAWPAELSRTVPSRVVLTTTTAGVDGAWRG